MTTRDMTTPGRLVRPRPSMRSLTPATTTVTSKSWNGNRHPPRARSRRAPVRRQTSLSGQPPATAKLSRPGMHWPAASESSGVRAGPCGSGPGRSVSAVGTAARAPRRCAPWTPPAPPASPPSSTHTPHPCTCAHGPFIVCLCARTLDRAHAPTHPSSCASHTGPQACPVCVQRTPVTTGMRPWSRSSKCCIPATSARERARERTHERTRARTHIQPAVPHPATQLAQTHARTRIHSSYTQTQTHTQTHARAQKSSQQHQIPAIDRTRQTPPSSLLRRP